MSEIERECLASIVAAASDYIFYNWFSDAAAEIRETISYLDGLVWGNPCH